MLLVLDNELRRKVSKSEVDPTISELNERLGLARQKMQELAAASETSWENLEEDSEEVFRNLQKSITDISKDLKKSLGIDQSRTAASGGSK